MKQRLLILGVLLLVLTGCAASPATTQAPTQTLTVAPTQTQTQVPSQTPMLVPTQAVAATQTKISLPTEIARPTARPDLEASDPAKFSLAAGKLQLVEFFAYW